MNDRIRVFAEQAELNLELQSIKVEKFAELIVRKCSEYADPTSRSYMLHHFGFEDEYSD